MGKGDKNGEKPKIQITESVKIGIHSTVFSVGESPNLKPNNVIDKILDNFIDKLEICLRSKPYHGNLPKPCHGVAFGVQLWSKEHH